MKQLTTFMAWLFPTHPSMFHWVVVFPIAALLAALAITAVLLTLENRR